MEPVSDPYVTTPSSGKKAGLATWQWYAIGAVAGVAFILYLRSKSSSSSSSTDTTATAPNTADTQSVQQISDELAQLLGNQGTASPTTTTSAGSNPGLRHPVPKQPAYTTLPAGSTSTAGVGGTTTGTGTGTSKPGTGWPTGVRQTILVPPRGF